MAHRKRNEEGSVLPKLSASARTIKRWDLRHNVVQPQGTGFKKLTEVSETPKDTSGTFKPMKKVDL